MVEDLNVAGMTTSAKGSGHWRGKAGLNRSILDAAHGELRRQLAYKTAWYGSALLVADRWYSSSNTCSVGEPADLVGDGAYRIAFASSLLDDQAMPGSTVSRRASGQRCQASPAPRPLSRPPLRQWRLE